MDRLESAMFGGRMNSEGMGIAVLGALRNLAA